VRLLGQGALQDLEDLADDLNVHVRRAVAQCLAEMEYLTPGAKQALMRLAADEETAEFTQTALTAHNLSAIGPIPEPRQGMSVPIPAILGNDKNTLLGLLETWQENLPDMQKNFSLEELSEVDQALSLLIVYLREMEIPGD